jgi:hypothetical protein
VVGSDDALATPAIDVEVWEGHAPLVINATGGRIALRAVMRH